MTSVLPGIPTFMSANVDQIVTQAIRTALAKAQRLQTVFNPQEPPLVDNCPIANLIPTTAF